MEWDYKIPPWDLAELEQNAEPNMAAGGPSCSSLGSQPDVMDCSVDLKLGGLGNPEPPEKWKDQLRVTPASFSSPSKRARTPSTAGQNASCSVDGCKSDLSNCREYHRRHKVCEVHSKTPIVMVGGVEQRFCQQCSRFHLLVEFDEVKRSCRKRLDGHNRRRRKPQPESINSTSLFPVQRGTRFSTYAHISQTPPTESNWAGIVKTEEDALYTHPSPLQYIDSQLQVPVPLFCNYKEGKQFPFLRDGKDAFSRSAIQPSMCQPLLKTTVSSVESSSNKIFSDGLTQVFDSDCALSLLSSPTQTSSINVGQMLPANRIPMAQPLDSSLRYGCLDPYSGSQASGNVMATGFSCSGGVEDGQIGGVVVSDADADLSCQGLFHVGGEGSSDGASQSLPFTWQ